MAEIECPRCHGTGAVLCPKCHGTGTDDTGSGCKTCDPSEGISSAPSPGHAKCPRCHGKGFGITKG
jgi:DnaJ-class molecular chaperone